MGGCQGGEARAHFASLFSLLAVSKTMFCAAINIRKEFTAIYAGNSWHFNDENMKIITPIPLSLYIHIPWCVKKCPYCDFNSHTLKSGLPEQDYIQAVLQDLRQDLQHMPQREIQTIFIGGGTPSLFSPGALAQLLQGVNAQIPIAVDAEITLEANPGTVEQQRFLGFRAAGINRLSIGVQSFQPEKLQALGRIHDDKEAINAVRAAQNAGFDNINIDLMYGLPKQTVSEALLDLQTAVSLNPTHLSWYQLTLEPNTAFFHRPPTLPIDDVIWDMQLQGQAYLAGQGFNPYEISAYSKQGEVDRRCKHNLNYWLFGDYLGIGAGAHAKVTNYQTNSIERTWKIKHPKGYLNAQKALDPADKPRNGEISAFIGGVQALSASELPFEFMMNALRLYQPIPTALFTARTGLALTVIEPLLQQAAEKDLLHWNEQMIETTAVGKRYLNDLLTLFL